MLELHAAATWFMVGLIWFVQIVHYPLFRLVGEDRLGEYHQEHRRRIVALLAIPALAEIATGAALVWIRPDGVPLSAVLMAGALLGIAWIMTAAVQVPQHASIAAGAPALDQLVTSNWVRTLVWTARGAAVLWMLTL